MPVHSPACCGVRSSRAEHPAPSGWTPGLWECDKPEGWEWRCPSLQDSLLCWDPAGSARVLLFSELLCFSFLLVFSCCRESTKKHYISAVIFTAALPGTLNWSGLYCMRRCMYTVKETACAPENVLLKDNAGSWALALKSPLLFLVSSSLFCMTHFLLALIFPTQM